jgi:mRNA-degrading endonuclease RelE of RelBE toxin-antitoxin system
MARVTFTPEAARQYDELPVVIRARVLSIMVRLENWPRVSGAKPLRGALAGRYRMRTGDRLQFHVRGDMVVIEKVGHRDGFYDE